MGCSTGGDERKIYFRSKLYVRYASAWTVMLALYISLLCKLMSRIPTKYNNFVK